MKQKYVPLDKQSKRKRREFFAAQRMSWGEINPVTRTTRNEKAYDRKKSEQWHDDEPLFGFCFLSF